MEKVSRVLGFAIAAQAIAFFAVACWVRVADLGSVPGHNGDESFYGIQAARLARGESFRTHTASGNVVNPLLLGAQVPLHLVFAPSLLLLRIPAAVVGILAILAAYLALARVLDRSTAAITAALLAALPATVLYSRLGLEMSQVPLVSVLAAACAFRPHGLGLLLSLVAAYIIYPIDVFLVPILLPVYLVRTVQVRSGDPAAVRRALLRTAIVALLCGAAVAAVLLCRAMIRARLAASLGQFWQLDWGHFLGGFATSFLIPVSGADPSRFRGPFWCVLATAAAVGLPALIARRRWDRLALVGGLVASVALFHMAAGSGIYDEGSVRYSVAFFVPTILALACLIEATLPTSTGMTGRVPVLRRLGVGGTLAAAWVVLLSAGPVPRPGLARTTGRDRPDPFREVLAIVERAPAAPASKAAPPRAGRPTLVLGEDFMIAKPLEYYTLDRTDIVAIEAINLHDLWLQMVGHGHMVLPKIARIVSALEGGHYAVGRPGGFMEGLVTTAFPADRIRRMSLSFPDSPGGIVLYRVAPAPARDPAAPGAATAAAPEGTPARLR